MLHQMGKFVVKLFSTMKEASRWKKLEKMHNLFSDGSRAGLKIVKSEC
jgi:hypothetical protein